jgi:hypothetical protein
MAVIIGSPRFSISRLVRFAIGPSCQVSPVHLDRNPTHNSRTRRTCGGFLPSTQFWGGISHQKRHKRTNFSGDGEHQSVKCRSDPRYIYKRKNHRPGSFVKLGARAVSFCSSGILSGRAEKEYNHRHEKKGRCRGHPAQGNSSI